MGKSNIWFVKIDSDGNVAGLSQDTPESASQTLPRITTIHVVSWQQASTHKLAVQIDKQYVQFTDRQPAIYPDVPDIVI